VNQLVSETIIDGNIVSTPFSNLPRNISYFKLSLYPILSPHTYFTEFVIDYYGLTEEETEYVWKQYRNIINNKI
jgi:hypothetical protein